MNEEWLVALKTLPTEELLKLYRMQIEYKEPEEHIQCTLEVILGRFGKR